MIARPPVGPLALHDRTSCWNRGCEAPRSEGLTTLCSSAKGRAGTESSGVAHCMQNFAPSGFSWPQFEQVSTGDAIPRAHANASGRRSKPHEPGHLSNRATFWATESLWQNWNCWSWAA